MSRRSKHPRELSEEERALWQEATRRTTPMHPKRPERPPATATAPEALVPPKPVTPRDAPPLRVGARAKGEVPSHDLAGPIERQVAAQPVAMDRKKHRRMKRGQLVPEARIDLHGMTLAQAHPALTHFILDATAQGCRLVLVITGKGKSRPDHGPIPERHGALRHQVPHWLHSAPLRSVVLNVTQAHPKHGGHGAYYVYLRRSR